MSRGEPLDEAAATTFRSVAALINFVAPDRADIQYSNKEILRGMAQPGSGDLNRLKRELRYLKGRPQIAITIPYDGDRGQVEVSVDADFAGCMITRRSTCGGVATWGGAAIKSWSKTMSTIALSTGESELGAIVKGIAEGEGILSLLKDFDLHANLGLKSDASAAVGITQRVGLGRVRHLAVADLWVQQRVQRGEVSICKVPGKENPADLMTKPLDWPRIQELLGIMQLRVLNLDGLSRDDLTVVGE